MGNRSQHPLLYVESLMSDVAAAQFALDRLWARVRSLCYKPAITLDELDGLMAELRCIQSGLDAGRLALQAERAGIGKGE